MTRLCNSSPTLVKSRIPSGDCGVLKYTIYHFFFNTNNDFYDRAKCILLLLPIMRSWPDCTFHCHFSGGGGGGIATTTETEGETE